MKTTLDIRQLSDREIRESSFTYQTYKEHGIAQIQRALKQMVEIKIPNKKSPVRS